MLYLSLLLFLIAIGSINLQRTKNPDAMIEGSSKGMLLMLVGTFLPFLMLYSTVSVLWGLNWYWTVPISILLSVFLSSILASLYSSFLGYKTKPQLSLFQGGNVRHNIHIIDAIITFTVGLIIYFIAK